MFAVFAQTRAEVISVVLFGLIIIFWLIGIAIGRRHAHDDEKDISGNVKVAEACLAILGLLLAFSFAAAYSKYEARRESVVQEANAISTFATRAKLLPPAVRSKVEADLREYVRLHLEVVTTGLNREHAREFGMQMVALQNNIADTVLQALDSPDTRPLGILVLNPMNAMFDQYEARAAALVSHVPETVVALLMTVSILSALMLGRSQGMSQKHTPIVTLIFLFLITFIIYITLDLDQPWYGLTQTNQSPMIRLANSLGVK